MIRFLTATLLALALVACVPAFEPAGPAPGVTVEAVETTPGDWTVTVRAEPAVDRLLLAFYGAELRVNAPECVTLPTQVQCTTGAVTLYEINVLGPLANRAYWGVAYRGDTGYVLEVQR